uniref:Uncharacterized protein n=1 Tax=Compsopogon caeruleus TaxID=31354 RepID=A0A7S1TDA6_9RHOD
MPIITAFLQKDPPDMHGALRHILRYPPEKQEKCIDYLFVLSKDARRVYQEALATHDLRLADMVATQSQMDPKEYGPYLRRLDGLDKDRKAFEIDHELGKYSSALFHLLNAGAREEALDYCLDHALYEEGIRHFCLDNDALRRISKTYALHLSNEGRHGYAASRLASINEWQLAAEEYGKAKQWQFSLSCARRCMQSSDFNKFSASLADSLRNGGEPLGAAIIYSQHLQDTSTGLDVLLSACEWEAASELTCREDSGEYRERLLQALCAAAEGQLDHLEDLRRKLRERRDRLLVVRDYKASLAEALNDLEVNLEDSSSDVFTQSDASTMASDFTFASRTSHATILSDRAAAQRREKATLKRKKKMENRKVRIREGHPQEEEYLVGYLHRILPNSSTMTPIRSLVRGMLAEGLAAEATDVEDSVDEYIELSRQVAERVGLQLGDDAGVPERLTMKPARIN